VTPTSQDQNPTTNQEEVKLLDLGGALAQRYKLLILAPLAVGVLAYGLSGFLAPKFTAKASFLPPQQQQGSLSSALASLGPLAGLGGQAVRNPSEQYVSFMQSQTVADHVIDRFDLIKIYQSEYRADARMELLGRVRFTIGKKDGLIFIEADDQDPKRAADLANAHIDELRKLTAKLAVTEAQQRRVFFETQLEQTRDRLTKAQIALQGSGFSQGALKAEPRAAADGYARLQAEVTSAEVRVQSMRGTYSEQAPEFRQAQATLQALRSQLSRAEGTTESRAIGSDYITKYREFKYQETLFDLFARQYEMARVDESREGSVVQVVDAALPPEKRTGPRRARIAAGAALLTAFVLAAGVIAQLLLPDSGSGVFSRVLRALRRRVPGG
jgi:uncharacterized protein involved in exopolysaccharide biosynthesis